MSFTITYQKLFTVRIKDADDNSDLRILQFKPVASCQRTLEKYKLIFRSRESGFDVYYGMYPDASEPLVTPIEMKEIFTFSVRVTDSEFFTRYEPAAQSLPQFYLDNLKSDGSINNTPPGNLTGSEHFDEDDLATIHGRTFSQRTGIPDIDPPTEWRVTEKFPPNTILQTIPVENPAGADVVYVRINDKIESGSDYLEQDGPYILRTDKPQPSPATIYLSNVLKGPRTNGVLDIHWNSLQTSAPSPDGRAYQVLLKRI